MRAMLAVTEFSLGHNVFTGMLPKNGLRDVAFSRFDIFKNRFAGALPDGGMRAMLAVTRFSLGHNIFTGMLPKS
eukprot:1421706-Amphidinium_carterae.1